MKAEEKLKELYKLEASTVSRDKEGYITMTGYSAMNIGAEYIIADLVAERLKNEHL